MRDVVVVGGGCYGTFYASQLAKAKARGKAAFRSVIVVDRDPACRAQRELGPSADRTFATREWHDYLADYLPGAAADDYLVPSPHMPHLMFEWVVGRARARWPGRRIAVAALPGEMGTPYDRSGDDGTRYVSFADWICPTHCVEPAMCPAIGSRRTWDIGEAVAGLVHRLRLTGRPVAGPALFMCRHQVFGVGAFGVGAVLAGDQLVAEAGASGTAVDVVVGTVSHCHGAVDLLALGPSAAAGRAGVA
jgi:hypothetical protein